MGITLEAQVVFYEVGVVELRHDVDLLADVLLLQGGLADGLGGQEGALGILDEEDLAEGAGSNGPARAPVRRRPAPGSSG